MVDGIARSVLIVDDDQAVLKTFRAVLSLRLPGWMFDIAASGHEALALAGKHEYTVVLSDVEMPELDGLSLMARLKGMCPDTPVMLVTGNANLLLTLVGTGAFAFMRKPPDWYYCVSALRNAGRYYELRKKIEAARRQMRQLHDETEEMLRVMKEESRKIWDQH